MSEVLRVGDLATVTMGLSPSGSTYNESRDGMPLLNGPTEFGPRSPQATLFTTDPKRVCDVGDLIFCVRGNTTGKWNVADRPYALGRGVAGIRGHRPTDTDFVAYALEVGLPRLLGLAGGSTMPNLRKGDIETFEVFVPAGRETIVAIVRSIDDLIENNRRQIEVLEETARLIYREWFVHFRFPGYEEVEFVESKVGPIPEGWGHETLADAAHLVMGQSPKSEFYNDVGLGLPFHQGVSNFGVRYPEHKKWCTQKNRIAERGDVLLSVRAPVGRINVAPERLVIGRGLAALRSKRNAQVLLFEMLREVFYEEDSMGGGTIFKAVTRKDLETIGIVRPPERLEAEFESAVGPMFDLVGNLTRQTRALRGARDLLLPRLISGELDVSALDLDLKPVA